MKLGCQKLKNSLKRITYDSMDIDCWCVMISKAYKNYNCPAKCQKNIEKNPKLHIECVKQARTFMF